METISIDLEAYERLKQVQRENESFSQTIKRVIRPPFDLDAWLRGTSKLQLSKEAITAIEQQIAGRRRRSPRR